MFLNPLLLLGVGAAVVPLVLHLLSRARYAEVDWAAMMFLHGSEARQRQSSRFSQYLLLLVRGATVGLLAVALARPVLRPAGAGGVGEGQLAAAIVLDCSASMSLDEGGQVRLDAAKAAARQILENLQPGDAAALVVAGAEGGNDGRGADAVVDFPATPDLRAVADRVAACRAGAARADLRLALDRAAARLAASGAATQHVYVITDRQASSWRDVGQGFASSWRTRQQRGEGGRGAEPLIRLYAVPVGGTDAQNVSVERVRLVNPPAVRGQPADVEVELRNYGPVRWAALPVKLHLGDKPVAEAAVNLSPGGTGAVRAAVRLDRAGSHVLSAEVDAPGLQYDDRLELAVEAVEPLKVLILSGDERQDPLRGESSFLRIALAPFKARGQQGPDPCDVTVVPAENWGGVNMKDFQVVVLANVERFTPAQEKAVEQFVYDGGGLLVAPGNLSRYEEYNGSLYRNGAGVLPAELYPPTSADGSQATALLGINLDHPVFQFVKGRPDPIPPVTIGRYFPAVRRSDASYLGTYGTGDAFLIEGSSGRGRVLLITTPLDADWATLPLSNFYLPFVQSAARYLAAGAIPDRNLRPGQALEASFDAAVAARGATLFTPDGGKLDLPVLRYGGRAEVRHADTARPGRYRLVARGEKGEQTFHYVVAAPHDESDLTQLSPQRWAELEQDLGLRRLEIGDRPIAAALAGPRGGRELWGAVLALVMLLAVAELFIGRAIARASG